MIFMEEPVVSNLTDGSLPLARQQSYPAPSFPAWLPAVTVAVSMVLFLAGSFYFRHRKVMRKRQILMDYFYIIFQYGGTRRKRMVTALCNTNAITLRELGRSFMISCDSMTGNDNDSSCPFYFDDSPYGKPHGNLRRPLTKKYSMLKRGFTITRRNRGPFLRFKTQSEENSRQYPHSFQDIVMKLGGRRHHEDSSRSRTTNRHALLTPQFEGCSMSTIHGDEMEYEKPQENCEKSEYSNRQRRNAHIIQYDKTTPRFADVATEAARQSLGHGVPDQLNEQHSPYSGKRNSEPWHHPYDQRSQTQGLQPDVFHVQGGRLSPSNVVCGSHGYISSIDKDNNACPQYRNSEPTIMVHSPSVDGDASQGWNDIRSRYTNGVVFLKRISKEDGSPGEYYYEEARTPAVDRPVRTSLSKVSYVPSGNMNQYQNCILSPNKDKPPKEEETVSKKAKGENACQGVSKSKRGRLNLGRMGVGHFSRRIDMASDSLQDYEPEHPADNKSSPEAANHQRASPRTTWTRFKNVFSGSRDTGNCSSPAKPTTSLPVTEQHKVKTRSDRSNWQRFLSVFTGFRSFPESKEDDDLVNLPKSSNSVPLGLNLIGNNSNAYLRDIEAGRNLIGNNSNAYLTDIEAGRNLIGNNSNASLTDIEAGRNLIGNNSNAYLTDIEAGRNLIGNNSNAYLTDIEAGRNLIGNNSNAYLTDIEAGRNMLPSEASSHSSPESSKHVTLSAASSFSDNGRESSIGNSCTVFQPDHHRPTSLNLNSRTQSFPDEIIHQRQYLQRFQKVFDGTGLIKNRPFQNRSVSQRYGKLDNCFVSRAGPLSKTKRDFKSYSFEAGYFSPVGEYRFRPCPTVKDTSHAATPDRLEGSSCASEISVCPRRFRSLSPLLEIACADSSKGACTTNLESAPSCSVYMTPIENSGNRYSYSSDTKSCEEILHPDVLALEQDALVCSSPNFQRPDFLSVNSNFSTNTSADEHNVNIEETNHSHSQMTEPACLHSDYFDACLQSNTIFGSNDKLPHSCFLKPNNKMVSRSTDSLYYDTVSALGTPSPTDPKDTDFAQISLNGCNCGNTDTGRLNFIDNDIFNTTPPSSYDASLSPDVSDTQTPAPPEPPIISPANVPSFKQSRSLSDESQASLDRQCNLVPYVLSTEIHTTQETGYTEETTIENLQNPPATNIECTPFENIQRSSNEAQFRAPMLARAFDRRQYESLPIPARPSYNNECQNSSSESSPKSSRSSTPTRRHSNPSPSPERGQYGRSGCYTPDEIYMANVTRLPRLSQRLGHGGTMPSLCRVKYMHE